MTRPDPAPDPITHNVESIAAFYEREHHKVGRVQQVVEELSNVVGRPVFLGCILVFVILWIVANVAALQLGIPVFDPAPFSWLQGIVSLLALLTTMVVLVRQDRLAKLGERRLHLDLQVNLLTDQKSTKLIHLIEELRRDLPMVKDRHDLEAEAMERPTDPHRVLAEIDEARVAAEHPLHNGEHAGQHDTAKAVPGAGMAPQARAVDGSGR